MPQPAPLGSGDGSCPSVRSGRGRFAVDPGKTEQRLRMPPDSGRAVRVWVWSSHGELSWGLERPALTEPASEGTRKMVSVMPAHQAWPGDQPPPPAGCPPFLPQARLFLLHCAASTFLCLLVLLADLLSQSISLALASESLFLAFPCLSTPLRVCRSPSVFVSVFTSPRVSSALSLPFSVSPSTSALALPLPGSS